MGDDNEEEISEDREMVLGFIPYGDDVEEHEDIPDVDMVLGFIGFND